MKTRTRSYLTTLPNTPESKEKVKALRQMLRHIGFAGRIRLQTRGKNRRETWEKLGRPTWSLSHFNPPLEVCERFDVYLHRR